MKKETKKKPGLCRKLCSYSNKEVSKTSEYAEAVIMLAMLGFLISILLKIFLPNLAPNEVNSLTVYRFSIFMILLGIALLLYKSKD